MKKYLIIAFTLLILISEGCKKYEDGPWISCRSKKMRLVGTYEITEYLINSIDSTNNIKNRFKFNIDYEDRKDSRGQKNETRKTISIRDSEKDTTVRMGDIYGEWDFLDDDKKFSMRFLDKRNGIPFDYNEGTGPFGTYKLSVWYIKRLTYDDFWLETEYESNIYYLKLKKTAWYAGKKKQ